MLLCFPSLFLLRRGRQLSCCGGLRTTHALCVPRVRVCSCGWFKLAGSWRHQRSGAQWHTTEHITFMLSLSPRKTVTSKSNAKVTVATHRAVWWLVSFPQCVWAARELRIDEKSLTHVPTQKHCAKTVLVVQWIAFSGRPGWVSADRFDHTVGPFGHAVVCCVFNKLLQCDWSQRYHDLQCSVLLGKIKVGNGLDYKFCNNSIIKYVKLLICFW